VLQTHFHTPSDSDWVRVEAHRCFSYLVQTEPVEGVPLVDPVVALYALDAQGQAQLLSESNKGGIAEHASLTHQPTADGPLFCAFAKRTGGRGNASCMDCALWLPQRREKTAFCLPP